MRVIQLTDLHIGGVAEPTYGVDVRSNFLQILGEVRFAKADHVVLTGDFCYQNGDLEIYQWIKDRLDKLDIPYDLIPGNHDDADLMAQTFNREHLLNQGEFYFAKKFDKWICLFLDSSRGKHSDLQLKWLKRQLHQANEPVIIFMHHPPVKVGIPYMDDNHALQDIDAIQRILTAYPHRVQVYTGHYHVEKTIQFDNVCVQVTPSCFFQMDQSSLTFKVDHYQIAMRIIDLSSNRIASTVRYFEGQKNNL